MREETLLSEGLDCCISESEDRRVSFVPLSEGERAFSSVFPLSLPATMLIHSSQVSIRIAITSFLLLLAMHLLLLAMHLQLLAKESTTLHHVMSYSTMSLDVRLGCQADLGNVAREGLLTSVPSYTTSSV